jgi:glycerol-3-phosphate dehydrogenase (NAD(P)+)
MRQTVHQARRIGIVGAGAFGTSLAICYSKEFDVVLFSAFDGQVQSMRLSRVSEFLPGFRIPDNVGIVPLSDISRELFDYLLWCLPSRPSLQVLCDIKSLIDGGDIVICSKGVAEDGRFLSEAFAEALPSSKIACLSGPNFAAEIAGCAQSAADIALDDPTDAEKFALELSTKSFRLVPRSDTIGVQLCGVVKNVIAIACGIADGLGLGMNAHSALLSVSIREIAELGLRLGALRETVFGLCGIGDIVLTASSCDSRNTTLGKRIAHGDDAEAVIKSTAAVCEGYDSTRHVVDLARRTGVELPVCEAVHGILFNKQPPSLILDVLRSLR